MPRCPFCDKRNSSSATECAQCGAELSTPDSRSSSATSNDAAAGQAEIDEAVAESELEPFEAEMAGLLKEGQKIEAIKRYRKKTGADLRSAKVAVEQFAARQGLSGSQSGCGTASAILLAVVVASWMLF